MSAAARQDGNRKTMLATVHIARKQLGLDEDAYRDVLERVTGRRSSGDCSVRELRLAIEEFRRLGFAAKPARVASDKPWVRKVYAIWGDIRPLLDEAADEALRGFVRRQTKSAVHPDGVDAPEWLTAEEAKPVIEGLKGWLARLRRAREAADG